MWSRIVCLALTAQLAPVAAFAQMPGGDGPPPEIRAKLDAARAGARDAALASLSADHRTKVQAIVDGFDASGSTMTVTDAAAQIDAILTKDEATSVLAQQQPLREAMRSAFADGGGPGGPGGGGFGGPGGGGRGPGGGEGHEGRRRPADAGRFLLSVDASQERYRAAMEAERGSTQPRP